MTDIIRILLGAFTNRTRGGLLNHIPWVDKIDKLVQPVVFGIVTQDAGRGLLMFIGQQSGWGEYIGAMSGFNPARPEQAWIDAIIKRLAKYPRIWGFLGLMIRGMYWGFMLGCSIDFAMRSVTLVNPVMVLYGALMPVFYWPCLELSKYLQLKLGRDKVRSDAGWSWAEWLWGGFLWYVSC